MPENPILPSPNQVLGSKTNNLPSPDEVFNPKLRQGDTSIIQPTYTAPIDRQVDSAIDFLKQKGGRNGSTVMDSEWDVLKDVLKDPRATQEQRKNAILTIQGYDPKHTDDNTMYYNKREANGVYVPTALAYGEKPPRGYKVESVWGNQKEAEDDRWYTDLGKSLANGVLGAAQGVVDVAQIGTALVTGEESKYLNKLSNTAEALKFKKDSELNTPILNTEGITKFSDLLDKDRFDLSPKALWGSLNMAAESLTAFAGGSMGAATFIKGGKGFVQGLKGIDTAIDLSKAAQKAAIFTGSFVTQVGDVYDSGKEAGLNPRDAAAYSTAVGAGLAAIDASFGLDGKIMSNFFTNEKRNLFKTIIKTVEKDAAGNITENGFKQLVKESTVGYTKLAKNGIKEVVKDAVEEGSQEAAQEFTQKAGENLWDKMTDYERGIFGTDAFSAKSFGDYINSFATGLVSGAPMAIGSQMMKNKHDEQSINAYDRVKQGPEAVKALKADLAASVKSGDITDSEHEQAIFKIDSYQKYHEETKGVNLQPQDEKKAFELSFQIQGLKTEIPTNENEISKLDPISRAKVESKQKQAKELQSELNDVIRRGELKGEPVVPKKEEEKIAKEKEKEVATKSEEFQRRKKEAEAKLTQKEENPNFPIEPKLEAQPEYKADTRTYDEIPAEVFNHSKMNARTVHRVLRKKLSEAPNGEMDGQLFIHQYEYNGKKNRTIKVALGDGKIIKLASSMIINPSGLSGYVHTERFKGDIANEPVGVKVIELTSTEEGKAGKKVIKVYQKSTGKFLSWVKETNTGKAEALDKEGNSLYTPEQLDELEELKLQDEKPLPPDEVERLRNTPIVPIMPKSPKERGKEALSGVVGESKAKVEAEKASTTTPTDLEAQKEEYAKIDEIFKNGKNGLYQSPKTLKNKKYADNSSKGWKLHIQFKKGEVAKVAKFLYDNGLYFKAHNDGGTYFNSMANDGATIYIGSSEDALKISNLIKNNLGDILEENKSTQTFNIVDKNESIYSGSGSDITFSKGMGLRFDVAKTKHGWLGEKVGDERVTDKKYSEHGADSWFGKKNAGVPILTKYDQEFSKLSDKIRKGTTKGLTLEEWKKLYARALDIINESKQEAEKDFGKDFLGIDNIINAKYDAELKALESTTTTTTDLESKPAEEGTTKDKFKKSVELYYEATESEGASKKRSKANERKKFLEENPSIKYIDDNMQSIYKQLEAKNLLTKKGNCP